MFWISYEDLLRKYQHFDRTRLFGPEWIITQQWTTLNVPWSADYHSTKFMMDVTKSGPVVIVLSQVSFRRALARLYLLTIIAGHTLLQGSRWRVQLRAQVPS